MNDLDTSYRDQIDSLKKENSTLRGEVARLQHIISDQEVLLAQVAEAKTLSVGQIDTTFQDGPEV